MVGFSPFVGAHIKPDFVRRVPAPAFDSMNGVQRAHYLETHPESYTLVTRSPGDGGPEDDAPRERLLELGVEALDRILALEAFEELGADNPAFFLYRLTSGAHIQLGVVGLIETADYTSGRVKRHEQVRAARALHLSQHFEVLGVQSSPIALGYRADPAMRSRLDDILSRNEPVLSFTSGDGLEQAVWVVDDPDDCRGLSAAMEHHDVYIMDGHHRAAAAGALADRIGSPRADHMLCVLFSDDRVKIEPFHRRVGVDGSKDRDVWVQETKDALQLRECPDCETELPAMEGEVGVYLDGQWWTGILPLPATDSPLDAIDPLRLQSQIIGPILGVEPEHGGGQISYFLDAVDRRHLVDQLGPDEVLFVLREVTPTQVFDVADAGLDMPPKSTYVTPKPRSGVFLRRF